jgi:hypothetical protein
MELWCSECKVLLVLLRAFFINIEISINQLISTSRKIENQLLIKWYQILGYLWCIIVFPLVSFCLYTKLHWKSQKNYTISALLWPLEPQFSFFAALLSSCPSWSSLVVSLDSCFLVYSTLLRAFGCAAHLIPPLRQQIDPLHSSICLTSHLGLLLRFASPR